MKMIKMVGAAALCSAVTLTGCVSNTSSKPNAYFADESLRLAEYGVDQESYVSGCKISLTMAKAGCSTLSSELDQGICKIEASLDCALAYGGNIYYDYIKLLSPDYSKRMEKLTSYVEERLSKIRAYNSTATQVLLLDQAKIQEIGAKSEAIDPAKDKDKLEDVLDDMKELRFRYKNNLRLLAHTHVCFEKHIKILEEAKKKFDAYNKKRSASDKQLAKRFDQLTAQFHMQLENLYTTELKTAGDSKVLENTINYYEPAKQ